MFFEQCIVDLKELSLTISASRAPKRVRIPIEKASSSSPIHPAVLVNIRNA